MMCCLATSTLAACHRGDRHCVWCLLEAQHTQQRLQGPVLTSVCGRSLLRCAEGHPAAVRRRASHSAAGFLLQNTTACRGRHSQVITQNGVSARRASRCRHHKACAASTGTVSAAVPVCERVTLLQLLLHLLLLHWPPHLVEGDG